MQADHPILNPRQQNLTVMSGQGPVRRARRLKSGRNVLQLWHASGCNTEQHFRSCVEFFGLPATTADVLRRVAKLSY